MPIGLVRTAWAGTSGGPGITQLYVQKGTTFGELTAADAQAAVNAVRGFWNAVAGYLPDEVVLTVSPTVDQYTPIDGKLESSVTAATAPASVAGTSTATYSMAAGMKVNLNTTTVRNGRRVRGGIYIVPATSSVNSSLGTVGSPVRAAVNAAGATMLAALNTAGLALLVYSRPFDGSGTVAARGGAVAVVTNMETNEKGAIQRGRRD